MIYDIGFLIGYLAIPAALIIPAIVKAGKGKNYKGLLIAGVVIAVLATLGNFVGGKEITVLTIIETVCLVALSVVGIVLCRIKSKNPPSN